MGLEKIPTITIYKEDIIQLHGLYTRMSPSFSQVSLQNVGDVFTNEREGNLKGQAWNALLGESRTDF